MDERELTPEGQRLWDLLSNSRTVQEAAEKINRKKKALTPEQENIRVELKKLQQNSKLVVDHCSQAIKTLTEKEQYFGANENKVAALCHQNFIDRLQRILDGKPAFQEDTSQLEQVTQVIIIDMS